MGNVRGDAPRSHASERRAAAATPGAAGGAPAVAHDGDVTVRPAGARARSHRTRPCSGRTCLERPTSGLDDTFEAHDLVRWRALAVLDPPAERPRPQVELREERVALGLGVDPCQIDTIRDG